MALLGMLMIAAIFGSCGIIAVGIILYYVPDQRVRGQQLMGAGATCAIATITGITIVGIVLNGFPTGFNAVHLWGIVALGFAIRPLVNWYRQRKSSGQDS